MPKGYVVAHITVRDPEGYRNYVRLDTPVVERHGGRFLVRGGRAEVLEGDGHERHVVIEFDDFEAARAFYHDPDYQAAAEIRRRTADAVIVLVEGAE